MGRHDFALDPQRKRRREKSSDCTLPEQYTVNTVNTVGN